MNRGPILAVVGDQHLLLWDLAAGKELRTMKALRGSYVRLTFSPDGKLLADASFRSVVLWDAATGKENAVLQFQADKKAAMGSGTPDIMDTGITDFGATFPRRIHAFLEDITNGVPRDYLRASGRDARCGSHC